MATGSEAQDFLQQMGAAASAILGAVMADGTIAAAGRQGVDELATAFGQMWPDSISVQETGSIFNPTQGEVAAARRPDLPSFDELIADNRPAPAEPARAMEKETGMEM